jgi:hypothetical protein
MRSSLYLVVLLAQIDTLSGWVSYLHVHVVDCMGSLVTLDASVLFVN